tara:strand:- start:66663 stop:67016 length:354 start_codon:yes stop_codon:yes gene_type:complete
MREFNSIRHLAPKRVSLHNGFLASMGDNKCKQRRNNLMTQAYPSTALYLGASLLVSVASANVFLVKPGIEPTLFIVAVFVLVCLALPRRFFNANGRKAVVLAGIAAALLCHALLRLI